MTTTDNNITNDMTPAEAANLLVKLEEGHLAAWHSTHEARWPSGEYESRFQNAAEVDGVFRDLLWETVGNGMRQPGEPVEHFAQRAESEARHAEVRNVGRETTVPPVIQREGADATPEHAAPSRDETAARLLSDPSTPEARAYARAFSDAAAARVREARERDPLPEPDRTPGTPHPDPFLAERGWHVNEHGIYTRNPQPQATPQSDKELEAG